jgi:hypothetical protein
VAPFSNHSICPGGGLSCPSVCCPRPSTIKFSDEIHTHIEACYKPILSMSFKFHVYKEDGDLIFFILLFYQIPRCGAKTQVSGFTYRAYFNSTKNLQLVLYVYHPNKKEFLYPFYIYCLQTKISGLFKLCWNMPTTGPDKHLWKRMGV